MPSRLDTHREEPNWGRLVYDPPVSRRWLQAVDPRRGQAAYWPAGRTLEEVLDRTGYAEAFWWVVPIPALVVAAGGMVAVGSSRVGVIAAVLLALVGLSVGLSVFTSSGVPRLGVHLVQCGTEPGDVIGIQEGADVDVCGGLHPHRSGAPWRRTHRG